MESHRSLENLDGTEITVNLENQAPVATITNTRPLNVDRFAAQGFTATASDPDGSITVPDVLRPYMGGLERVDQPS